MYKAFKCHAELINSAASIRWPGAMLAPPDKFVTGMVAGFFNKELQIGAYKIRLIVTINTQSMDIQIAWQQKGL